MNGRIRANGFTLVELVAVMVIMGIIAIALLPRFTGIDVFASRGFYEQCLAATRYAHKLAVASGCSIRVSFAGAADTLTVSRWTGGADCTVRTGPLETVAQPGGGLLALDAPNDVDVIGDLTFYFDRIGRPRDLAGALITAPANLQIAIDDRTLQVTPETGLVRGL